MTTSASFVQASWLPLTERFQGARVVVSIDGFGAYHEYIRYPLRWDNFTANLWQLRAALPKAAFDVSITLQSYNMLNLVELFRYLDAVNLSFYINILDDPKHLRARAMPPRVRRLAAARLHDYARDDCRPEYQHWVNALAGGLETVDAPCDRELLRRFLLFTNDLDVSRGQSFRKTHAEMVRLLAEDGFEWTDETLYAPTPTARTRLKLPLVSG